MPTGVILDYDTMIGIWINSICIVWGESRSSIRRKIKWPYETKDNVFKLSSYVNGLNVPDIISRKDVYKNCNRGINYFFMDYDENDKLAAIEIHQGIRMTIFGKSIQIEEPIETALDKLQAEGFTYEVIDPGTYLFRKICIALSDSESMGGAGNALAYAYIGKSTNHL
jgi:hypothetical protein